MDSLITQKQPNGKLKQKDWIRPKVIHVEAHRGAMSYYGLATRGDDAKLDWSTLKWLTQAANRARPDASGSSVLYARVHLVEENTGLSQDTIGGTDGGFVFPRLPIGAYTISVEAPGFRRYEQTGISLQVGERKTLRIELQVGQVSESVTVQGEAPVVNTANAALGTVVDAKRTVDLPLKVSQKYRNQNVR